MISVHAAVIKQKGLGPEHVANVVGVATSAVPTKGKDAADTSEEVVSAASDELAKAKEVVVATSAFQLYRRA